jgi:hypothetical protein
MQAIHSGMQELQQEYRAAEQLTQARHANQLASITRKFEEQLFATKTEYEMAIKVNNNITDDARISISLQSAIVDRGDSDQHINNLEPVETGENKEESDVSISAPIKVGLGTGSPSFQSSPQASRNLAVPGTLARKYIEGLGSPSARPVSWVMQQANTEVKRLRERAEQLNNRGVSGLDIEEGVASDGVQSSKGLLMWKYRNIQYQLTEAMAVIEEQDRLIHEGIFNFVVLVFFVSYFVKTITN